MIKKAFIISVNDFFEHNFTLYNKSIFIGEIVSVIEQNNKWEVSVYDVIIQKLSYSNIISAFLKKPDVIFFYSEVNQSRLIHRLAKIAKNINDHSKIFVYGLATKFIPNYFYRQPFDAVHVSGDRELSIAKYLEYLDGTISQDKLCGIVLIGNKNQITISKKGGWLNENLWPVPNIQKLPLDDYIHFQKGRKLELAITATKGCKYQCNFCGCSDEEGTVDRTRDPKIIVNWAKKTFKNVDCLIHLYSPNILYNLEWIEKFFDAYSFYNANFEWQGVTRADTINEKTLSIISKSGCKKLAVGIEHINSKKLKPLKSSLEQLKKATSLCIKYNIKFFGLIMLGYPGQNIDDIKFILSLLRQLNISNYRFTGYTPLHRLKSLSQSELDRIFIENYDRRTFYIGDETSINPYDFYNILVTNGACLNF